MAAHNARSVKPFSLRLLRRRSRARAMAAALGIIAYVFTGAIVPAGHMAAGLEDGTPFHLCPGDLRSAQILGALSSASPADQKPAHHHHGGHGTGHGDAEAGTEQLTAVHPTESVSVKKSSADIGCSFAGTAVAASAADVSAIEPTGPEPAFFAPGTLATPRQPAWLRPPARSPPV